MEMKGWGVGWRMSSQVRSSYKHPQMRGEKKSGVSGVREGGTCLSQTQGKAKQHMCSGREVKEEGAGI